MGIVKIKLLLIGLCLLNTALAQRANVWYFGNYAGIDFNSSTPVAIKGSLNTNEGCAVICDDQGNMLLYTDGVKIYNSNHAVVNSSTPLYGNSSSTQSAIVVPKPDNSSRFYIFTMDKRYSGCVNGLNYTEVEINGTNINIVSANNHLLSCPETTEKIAVTAHSNGVDYWVITFKGNGEFVSWLVSSTGVASSPTVSTATALPCIANNDDRVGYMKVSPSGKYLVLGRRASNSVNEAFTFDNSSGKVTQNLGIYHVGTIYGVEFSSDENYFFASENFRKVAQYDWSFNRLELYKSPSGHENNVGALQIAPDGNIYVANGYEGYNGDFLDCITNVNTWGATYNDNYLPLASGTHSRLGLPTVISFSYITLQIQASKTIICNDKDSIKLTAEIKGGNPNNYTVVWETEDSTWSDTGTMVMVLPKINTTYKATLTKNGNKVAKTKTLSIVVGNTQKVEASFTLFPNIGCSPLFVSCIDSSINNDSTKNVWVTLNTQNTGGNFQQTYAQVGTHDIKLLVENNLGCKDSIVKTITVVEPPVASFITSVSEQQLGEEILFTNLSKYADKYTWYIDSGDILYHQQKISFTHSYNTKGRYWVSLVAENSIGCKDSTSQTLIIYDDNDYYFYIPNAFTPNKGDTLNNVFGPVFDGVKDYTLVIYNRWGEELLNCSNCMWDGTFKGEPAQDGVYLYIVSSKALSQGKSNFSGTFHLLR